jgi:hypothetical protein
VSGTAGGETAGGDDILGTDAGTAGVIIAAVAAAAVVTAGCEFWGVAGVNFMSGVDSTAAIGTEGEGAG